MAYHQDHPAETQAFFNTRLRRIFNIRWQDKIRNEDLWERAGQKSLTKQILRRKWGWIGHTLRKPASCTTRQALTWNPQGKRKRGRPRNTWRSDTEAEMSRYGTNWMGITKAAQNRVRWRGVVDDLCSTGEFPMAWLIDVSIMCMHDTSIAVKNWKDKRG